MRGMTTTTTDTSTVERFLAGARAGSGDDIRPLYAVDAVLDATVPGWRFRLDGPDAIAAQYAGWFSEPGTFDELAVLPVLGGAAVRYLVRSHEGGVPYAAHHCHLFEIGDDGLITRDTFFCGGRWGDELLAEMAEAQRGR